MDRKSEQFNLYLEMAIREGWTDPVGFANRRMDELERPKRGGPTAADPERPTCNPDGSCCDFCCGN